MMTEAYGPWWSSGQDLALSPLRPGFDSWPGKLFWPGRHTLPAFMIGSQAAIISSWTLY